MTVSELIKFLQQQPQDLLIAYEIYSEYSLLEQDDIQIKSLCVPRPDGWIHRKRPDKASREYLVFPGNKNF